MIGVDWGTSSFRAFLLGADGAVRDRRAAALGILHVEAGRFAEVLASQIGPWLEVGETRVLLAGMVGCRQGWVEAPYLPCPAGAADLARALVPVPFAAAEAKLVPGLSDTDAAGVPEVMRGEETQLVGVLAEFGGDGLACLPGSHSKWARLAQGHIAGYATHLTGEAFAALRGHTILGRMMRAGPTDLAAFDRGVARSADPGGLLHHLFGVRTLGLAGRLADAESASYLSGLLIGHEVRAALSAASQAPAVQLIGAAELCALYARAIAAAGGRAVRQDPDAAARGFALIGKLAQWS
jgi:2-dehydro-3-deoxygalactonokinase